MTKTTVKQPTVKLGAKYNDTPSTRLRRAGAKYAVAVPAMAKLNIFIFGIFIFRFFAFGDIAEEDAQAQREDRAGRQA